MTSDTQNSILEVPVTRQKQRIYEQAARMFRDRGYPATSMRHLAEAVGLEPSSLYSHIKSKEEILRHICFSVASEFVSGLKSIRDTGQSSSEMLRALILLHVQVAHDDVTSIVVFNDEWKHLSEPFLGEFSALRKKYEESCISIIKDGIGSGEFRHVEPYIVLNSILSSTLWVYKSSRIKESEPDNIAANIADLLIRGIKK